MSGTNMERPGPPRPEPAAVRLAIWQTEDCPDDLAEAFEATKLAIMRQQMEQWQAITRGDVLQLLEILADMARK